MRHVSLARIGFISLAFSMAAISGCASAASSSTPVVALPNGYYLQPDKSAQTVLVKRSGGRVFPATIAAYAVSGDVIAGALGATPPTARTCTNDCPFATTPETRYFVFDTATGKLDTDLDQAAWRRRLDELKVPASFKIYASLPWEQWLTSR